MVRRVHMFFSGKGRKNPIRAGKRKSERSEKKDILEGKLTALRRPFPTSRRPKEKGASLTKVSYYRRLYSEGGHNTESKKSLSRGG